MLTPDMCNWFEQRTGIPYDFDDDIAEIGGDYAFANPTDWSNTLYIILDHMVDALEVIENHRYEIPDDMPQKDDFKKIVTESVIEGILKNLNDVKSKLNIDSKKIHDFATLQKHINGIAKFIELMSENELDEIMSKGMFERLDKSMGNVLTDDFEINRPDLSQIHFNIIDIKENYSDLNDY